MLSANKRYGGLSPYNSDEVIVVHFPTSGPPDPTHAMINKNSKPRRPGGRLGRGEHGLLGRKAAKKRGF